MNTDTEDYYEVPNKVLEEVPTPKVSVITLTYNHEKYIRRCIESVINQRYSFPIEYIIGEDCSTDKTREIVLEYAEKYPGLIRVIAARQNTGGIQNAYRTFARARSRYIAICEGDDYWTDENKLNKQVRFLDQNSEYVLSFHDCKVIDRNGLIVSDSKVGNVKNSGYSKKELCKGKLVPTLSVVLNRKKIFEQVSRDDKNKIKNLDLFYFSMLSKYGAAYYHRDIEKGVYRIHTGGVWSQKDKVRKARSNYITFRLIYKYHEGKHKKWAKQEMYKKYLSYVLARLKQERKISKKDFLRANKIALKTFSSVSFMMLNILSMAVIFKDVLAIPMKKQARN